MTQSEHQTECRNNRKVIHILLIILLTLFTTSLGAYFLIDNFTGSQEGFILFTLTIFAGVILFTVNAVLWRCPNCDNSLGNSYPKLCPNCGIQIKEK